jgi:hypothetical protein
VAKTRKPCDLNSRSSAWPMPELQPVMRTVLGAIVVVVAVVVWVVEKKDYHVLFFLCEIGKNC